MAIFYLHFGGEVREAQWLGSPKVMHLPGEGILKSRFVDSKLLSFC